MAIKVFIDTATANLPGDFSEATKGIIASAGVASIDSNSFLVTGNVIDRSVNVATGYAYVDNSTYTLGNGSQKFYAFSSDASENVAITANASGNTRITSIFLKVLPGAANSVRGVDAGDIVAVDGTPAAAPVAPAAPVDGNSYLRLADVEVINGATTIGNSSITDRRVSMKLENNVYSEPILDNEDSLQGTETDGTLRNLAKTTSSNEAEYGDTDNSGTNIVAGGDITIQAAASSEVKIVTNERVKLYLTADISLTAGNVETIVFDTTVSGNVGGTTNIDQGVNSGNYDTSTGIYTAPYTGRYDILFSGVFQVGSANDRLRMYFKRNDIIMMEQSKEGGANGTNEGMVMADNQVYLEAGDTMRFQAANLDTNDNFKQSSSNVTRDSFISIRYTGL